MNVGEAIVAQLRQWGIKDVFGLSGSSILPLLEALRRQDHIHYWTVRHEESAAFMASAYAKLTGKLGVCLAHAGPGAAHLINGLYDAHKDRYPVLAITGQVARDKMGTSYKQSSDESLMFVGCTGFSRSIAAPQEALEILAAAMRYAIAMNDVAHVSVPSDLLAQPISNTSLYPPEPYLTTPPRVDPTTIDEAVKVLNAAKNPVILMGRGAIKDAQTVQAVAEQLQAPVITSLPAKGCLPETHPLVIGPIGEAGTDAALAAVQSCDVMLVLGSTWWPSQFIPKETRVVQVDLRPTTIGVSHPATVGIVGSIQEVLPKLTEKLASRRPREIPFHPQPFQTGSRDPFPAHPASILARIRQHLPKGAIITVDTGLVTLWYGRAFPARNETTLLSGRWRSMGFALPAALAAKIARPDAPVIALTGDGGFAMTGMEFATAVRYDLAVTVVVFNNGLLGEEAIKQTNANMPIYGMDLTNPDFSAFAMATGGLGFHPQTERELDDALEKALHSKQPSLVDVPTLLAAPPTLTESPQELGESVMAHP